MIELNSIQPTGIWASIAAQLNENFRKVCIGLQSVVDSYSSFKGYYEGYDTLLKYWNSPHPGATAWVGVPYPGVVYECRTEGVWSRTTHVPGTPGVDLNDYVKDADIVPLQVSINSLSDTLTTITGLFNPVSEEGFHFVDGSGMDVINYTSEGFDAAKVAGHLVSLILKKGSISLDMLSESLSGQLGSTGLVSEEGFHFVDGSGMDVLNYTAEGLDAAKLSGHFLEVLNAAGISGRLEYETVGNDEYDF